MVLNFNYLISKYNLKINGVIHIGAHVGSEHQMYKNNNIKHKAYFEPVSTTFNKLKETVGDEGLLFNYALGNETKNVEMYIETVNGGQSSSILEPEIHSIQYPTISFDSKETVKMTRLDDIELDRTNYNLINIDVQGYELEVFKGAIETLNNIDYIISEVNNAEVYKNCAKIDELIEFLKPYGFVLVEIDWIGGTWGDGFFIKEKLL